MGLREMLTLMKFALYGRLLLVSGKSLLLVGAPGVGKTRLAKLLGRQLNKEFLEPLVIVGRDGLTFDYLVLHYTLGKDGKPVEVLGDLAKAVVSSWIMLANNIGVRGVVFDEINRCNVDLVLGEVFTALDIEHRITTPVIKDRAYNKILQMISGKRVDELREELGLLSIELSPETLDKLKEFFKSRIGIPLPYSFRIIATMNMYDRAQLYRLGYALQRRFAMLYIPTVFERVEVEFNNDRVARLANTISNSPVYKALVSRDSTIVQQALRELYMASENNYGFEDYPTIIKPPPREILENQLDKILQIYGNDASMLVAYTYNVAQRMGVEIGVSVLVDIVKLYVASMLLSTDNEPVIPTNELTDLALSSLVIPQLSVVIPRIRSEILLVEPTSSTAYMTLRNYISEVKDILGDKSLSIKLLKGYAVEVPALLTS